MAKDPICGMTVDESSPLRAEHDGQTFYFCSEHCRKKFLAEPEARGKHGDAAKHHHGTGEHSCCATKASGHAESHAHHEHSDQAHDHSHTHEQHAGEEAKRSPAAKYYCPMCPGVESDEPGDCPKCGMALERNPAWKLPPKTIYTCPMHPEIEQDHPGTCPKCGMAMEPKTVSPEPEEDNAELRDMSRRLWVGAALALPVFVLAMAHLVPAWRHGEWVEGDAFRWVQFILSTPVVLWAGWPFFARGWRSLVNRSLNMFTLIGLGVGSAYVFSAAAMLFPQVFPASHGGKVGIYFEAAAVITVLVLVGQVLELRARQRTSGAIKALARSCAKNGAACHGERRGGRSAGHRSTR